MFYDVIQIIIAPAYNLFPFYVGGLWTALIIRMLSIAIDRYWNASDVVGPLKIVILRFTTPQFNECYWMNGVPVTW